MGTSTCDMLIAPLEDMDDKLINGIRGQVDGSIVPGMMGLEAGQSPFVMQIIADVLNMPIKVARSEQVCALGAAMFAAVAAGAYSTTAEAQKIMGGGIEIEYHPIHENVQKYEELYKKYKEFGAFIEKTS